MTKKSTERKRKVDQCQLVFEDCALAQKSQVSMRKVHDLGFESSKNPLIHIHRSGSEVIIETEEAI